MSRRPAALVCQGRPVDDAGRAVGEVCGKTFDGFTVATPDGWPADPTPEQVADQARSAGWSVAGPPMCPKCRKPDPAVIRGLTTTKERT